MWGNVDDGAKFLKMAIEFTSNHNLYGSFMHRVVNEWHYSCLNALTDSSLNQKAWVGHAAAALAMGCPEYITRKAWSYLSNVEREMANWQARKSIQLWQQDYAQKSGGVHKHMDEPLLF
jgi:hypothetical protein